MRQILDTQKGQKHPRVWKDTQMKTPLGLSGDKEEIGSKERGRCSRARWEEEGRKEEEGCYSEFH